MPDFDPLAIQAGLDALDKVARPTQQATNPYSTATSTSRSKYLDGLTRNTNPEYIKAVNQGFFDTMGNAIAQTGVGMGLEIGEGIGYLGVGNLVDAVKGTEQEFGNSLSTKLREWNEQFKQEGMPVYTTPDDEGFKPWDYKWWGANAPSIASAVSLLIPAAGAVRGLGKLGKAMGGLNVAKKLGITTEALGAAEAIGMAATSRHMEGMMEGMEVYQTLYERAKEAGKSENEAVEIAGNGARDLYLRNAPLITTDIIQFGLAFKSFNNISRIHAVEKASKNILQQIAIQSGLEAGEEGYQFIASAEAERKALVNSKIDKDDYSTYPERLLKYVTDGDFYTSAFMGALGGAAFEGAGSAMERNSLEKQKIVNDIHRSALEKSLATLQENPTMFAKSTDVDMSRIMIAGIEAGRADMIETFLNTMSEGKVEGQDGEAVKQRAATALQDLKYLESVYTNIHKDPTKSNNLELSRFELMNRAEVRSNGRLAKTLSTIQSANLEEIGNQRGLDSSYLSLLQAETELELLNTEFKDKAPAEQAIKDRKVKELQEVITRHRDTIKTNENIDDKTITEKLSINKTDLVETSRYKVMFDLMINQDNADYDKLQTTKGREEITTQLKEFKDKQVNSDLKSLTDQITPQTKDADIIALREAAKKIGKEKEFNEARDKILNDIKATSTKFSPTAPVQSLTDRFNDAPLLADHELNEISKIALTTGGMPTADALTPETIGDHYTKNPAFAAKINAYYAKTDSLLNIPKTQDVGKQPIKENIEEPGKDNTEAVKEPIKQPTNNRTAWTTTIPQFEMTDGKPDTSKPATSGISKKINWKFLNQGGLPQDATIHFEYDFNDVWNRDHSDKNVKLFEYVYYVDGNTNNKQTNNRMVVGALPSYVENAAYETAEAKADLKALRERLMQAVDATGFKAGIATLPITTQVAKVHGGRFWNTKEFSNPLDVIRAGQQLTLAIGITHKLGDQTTVVLSTNGSALQDRIQYKTAEPGMLYMLLEDNSGYVIPYKMFTKKVKELPTMSPLIAEEVRKIKDAENADEKLQIIKDINELVYIKDINYSGDTYYITTGSHDNVTITPIKDNELETFIGDLIIQVDVNKINQGDYNELISNQGFITTDLNPYTYFHSTRLDIVPVKSVVATAPVAIPNSDIPIPTSVEVNINTVKTEAIKGAGKTKVTFGKKGKPSYVQEGLSYTPLNETAVRTWFAKNLPQVDVSFADNLIENHKQGGPKAWGVFYANAVTLYRAAPKGTEHHEAFHAVFNSILNDAERETILNEARTIYGDKAIQKIIDKGYTKNQLEELLADDFARYVQQNGENDGTLGYNIKAFFKKLYNFIRTLFTKGAEQTSTPIENLFFRINTGFYKDRVLTKSNTRRYKVSADPYRVTRNINTINSLFFQALHEIRDNSKLQGYSDIQVLNQIDPNPTVSLFKVYSNVHNGLVEARDEAIDNKDEALAKELTELTDNFIKVTDGQVAELGDYYPLALRDLAKFGINAVGTKPLSLSTYDSQVDENIYELSEEETVLEGYQIKALQVNGKDTLSFDVRRTLRLTSEYFINENNEFEEATDSYGFKKFINFDEVHNYLERNLADHLDSDVMFAKLEELKYHRPELHGIIEKINEDSNLRSQFFVDFAKSYTPYIQAIQRTKRWNSFGIDQSETKISLYNANRKNLAQILIDDWNLNLITSSRNQITDKDNKIVKEKAEGFLKQYEDIINGIKTRKKVTLEENQKISDLLLKFGVDIDASTLQKEFSAKPMAFAGKMITLNPYETYIDFVDNNFGSVKTLLKTIVGGVNPYKGEFSQTSAAVKVAKTVQRNIPNLHQDTFINIEGKQVFSYLQPTFLNKKLQEYKTPLGREGYLSNWWFKSNKWLQDLNVTNNEDLLKNFELVLLDGLHMENKQPTKYFSMTDQELDITDLNMFDNNQSKAYGYYRLPILSDSSQAPYIKFKKYNEIEVVDALYQLALAEKDRILMAQVSDIKIKNFNDEVGNGLKYNFVPIFNDPTIDIANEDTAKAAIRKWLEDEGRLEQTRLIDNGVMQKNGGFNRNVTDVTSRNKDFLRGYFYNKVLANAMMTQLLSVDLAYYKNFDDFQKRNAQVYKFTKMIDVEASWKGFTPEKTYNVVYVNDSIIKSELKEGVYNDLIEKGYSPEYATKVSKAYDSVNQTDAQTYITVDRYRKIQIGLGEWNDQKEKIYRLVKKGKAYDDANAIFNPIKPFYFGHEVIPGTDIVVPVQHKNSEVVLLPNLAKKSPTLTKLLKFMETKKIDSVAFTSAVKAGQYGATDVANVENATVHVMDNKYWGIQQETPTHHVETENLFGSQIRKLIIADIPNDTKFGKYTKKEIVDIYQRLIVDNIKESYTELEEELGTIEKVQYVLLKQVIERNLGENYEKALEIVTDNNGNKVFNLPLYHPIHAKRFETVLNAIVRNKVIRQKINGGSFVLMSNFGFTDELKVVRNKDGGIDYMEVMLPAWAKDNFPRKPNGEVDIEAIRADDPTILDLFGYRIPTEHKYSMKKLKVVGFTPDIMGGVAMLPAEITTIAGEDFDIDKLYVMMPNFETVNGRLKKIKYDLDKIDTLDKQQRDNALIDIIGEIWSNPAVSDQILNPGGFETLKQLAKESPIRIAQEMTVENPLLPRTQMGYFTRNTNGGQLIGIAANHNTNHAITQFTQIALTKDVLFNGEGLNKFNTTKALDDKLISRNLAEFLAAFVDNAKDPVAGDLNLNTYTFDTVAMIVRLGYDLNTATSFITQPAIVQLTKEYFREGGTRKAEKDAFDTVIKAIKKGKKLEVQPEIYALFPDRLQRPLDSNLERLTPEMAEEQLKVLYTFREYKKLADSLGKLVRSTKSDSVGTRKTIAGNTKAIQDIERVLVDTNLTGVTSLLKGTDYPIVSEGTEYGLIKPQEEVLAKFFPYANNAYVSMYTQLENNKGQELTEDEINYVNNLSLIYYTSGFGYFDLKEKDKWINRYPAFFDNAVNESKEVLKQYEIIKYIRYVPASEDQAIPKIEFISGATVGNEQRELLQKSWEAMIGSDDPAISKIGRDLVKYSFMTNGLSFSYGGFSHLIPTGYIDKLIDDQGLNFRDYLYNLQDEAGSHTLFNNFIDQLFRHDVKQKGLLPKLVKDNIINTITKANRVTSILVKKDTLNKDSTGQILSKYFKYRLGANEYTYKYNGITTSGDAVYNILEPLGEGANVYEYNILERPSTVIRENQFPELEDTAFFSTTDASSPGEEMYQLNNTRDLEIKYALVDVNGTYKSYGKDGKGQVSTKAYNKLRQDLININSQLRGTGFKAIAGKQPDGKGEINWIAQIVDEFYQGDSNSSLEPNEQLNDLLRGNLSTIGVKVEYYEDLKSRLSDDVNAVTDVTLKLIKISQKGERVDTLPEEVGHIAETYNRGSAAHTRLMELVVNTPEYARVVQEYGEEYEGNELKLKQEAIGKLIGSAIIKKSKGNNNNVIMTFLNKLWNDFVNLFKKVNEDTLRQEINDITGELAVNVLEGNFDSWPTSMTVDGKFYQLGSKSEEQAKKLLETGIDSINKKIKIYEKRALTSFTEREKAILGTLQDDLKKGLYKRGLLDYTIAAKRELRRVAKAFEKIDRNPATIEAKRDTIKTLKQMNNFVSGFKDTLNGIAASDQFTGGTADMRNVSRFVSETAELVNKLETEYYKIGKPILADILREFSTNTKLNMSEALDTLEKDISWTQRFLDQLAEVDDSILNIMDVMVKDAKHRARIRTIGVSKEFLEAQKELERNGITSTGFMFERDFSGALTSRMVTEYNVGEFNKQKDAFFKANPKPAPPDVSTDYSEKEYKAKIKLWNEKIGDWFKDNTQEHPSREKIVADKKEEFAKLFPNPKLAEQKFNEWYGKNVRETTYFDYQQGDYVTDVKYQKELAIPAEKYRSQVYKDIQANPVQAKYYALVDKYLKQADNNLPEIYKLNGLTPQIRKDFYERLAFVDKDGKKTFKSLREIGKETKTTIGEQFIRHESDLEYGLTDENNQLVNFLPVRFARKISDPANLSLDMTSNMIAFMYSVNDFSEMSKIIDTLEFAKDVVGERAVKTGKFDPVTMFKNVDEKGKPIVIEGGESLAYKRLVDWMNMTVYGQQSKDEGKLFGLDKGKLADFVNGFTSLSSLALNLYSGISNVTVGTAMTRMEAVAGEFVTNKDLLIADKVYATELPGTLVNIGQRLETNKLGLWLEYMDTMQNYDREYRNVDAGRNTVFGRLMKTSSLYFINHAGEHLIQTRMSLALANNTKVKDLLGNEMTLWEAFEVEGNRLVLKPGLLKVKGDKTTSLFKESEDGQPLTERDIIRFINRQNFLNKRLHGIYNNVDKSAVQQYALGRLVMMFRKFIKPGWNRRFAKWTYNEEGEAATEGYYTTAGRFLQNMYKEIKEGQFSIAKNWGNLNDAEKANFFRLATEWAYVIAAVTAANVLAGFADDDEDNYFLNLAAYEAYRMYSEIRFFTSGTEMWRIVKSPAPAVYTIDKVIKFMDVWNWNTEIQRGKYKGLNRFEVGALNLIPLGGTFINVRTPEEQLRFYTNNGVTLF